MISSIVSRLVILVFGTLYPAYASYKAVRTKNVKEYVKWMMYWIVFALFTCAETFTDVFLSFWFPFYYEIKIILVLWLLSPATKGSSILYRKFVHPMLSRREQEIDEYIAKAKEQGYHTVLHLGTKGVNYATTVLMQTAIKGGGGLVNQLRRSYSLSDLSSEKESDMNRNSKTLKNVPDEDDMEEEETDSLDPRMLRPRGYSPRRSASGSGRVEMYFPEVDVDVLQHGSSRPREPSIPLSHIRSSEDVSSGYSSAEPLYAGHHATKSEGLAASREPLVRTASVGSTRSMRTKSSRGGVVAKRVPAAEDSDFWDLQGDEADQHYHQEDCFYDVTSSSVSQPIMSIKPPVYFTNKSNVPLSTLPESTIPLTVSEIGGSNSNDNASVQHYVEASDVKVESAEDDEDMPLYDAETDEPTPLSKLLPQSESTQCDIPTSGVESPLFINPVVSNVGDTTNTVVSHSDFTPTEKVPSHDPSLSDPHTTVPVVDTPTCLDDKVDEICNQNENIISVTSPIIKVKSPLTESVNIGHVENELKHMVQIEKLESPLSVEEKLENLDNDRYSEKPNNIEQQAHTTAVIPDDIKEESLTDFNTTANDSNIIENVLNVSIQEAIETVESSDMQDENTPLCTSQVDETTTEAQSVLTAFPLTPTDLVSSDNMMHISTLGDSKCGSDIDQSNNCNVGIVDTKSELGGICIREDAVKEVTDASKDMIETLKETNDNITANANNIVQNLHEDDGMKSLKDNSGSAYASVESLSPLQPPSRSGSQSSLRKESRAGRYHKRPAPTPPPSRTSESESDNYTDIQEQTTLESPEFDDNSRKVSPSPKEKDIVENIPVSQAVGKESSESAVTARLVLKPGVVRSLGPDPDTKTEVFVSKTPQTKGKKSKSKSKQGDSSLSRLFSLLPFWHGKQEGSTSSDTQNRTSGSSDVPSSSSLQSSSNSAFVPLQGKAQTETNKQLGKKNRSHSPAQHHRAPLAGCE